MALHFHRPIPNAINVPSLRASLRDQWQRIRAGFGNGHPITDLAGLYHAELYDLHSAEQQLCALVDEIWVTIRHEPLAQRVGEYATEVRSRVTEIENLLSEVGASSRKHPDEAMQALVHETSKVAELCAENVRDAALLAALQRIIHYLVADYGTLAAHAKVLGRLTEAARFAQHADRNQSVDVELSVLAKVTLNPQAAVPPS